MRGDVHVRFGEERQRNSSTTPLSLTRLKTWPGWAYSRAEARRKWRANQLRRLLRGAMGDDGRAKYLRMGVLLSARADVLGTVEETGRERDWGVAGSHESGLRFFRCYCSANRRVMVPRIEPSALNVVSSKLRRPSWLNVERTALRLECT